MDLAETLRYAETLRGALTCIVRFYSKVKYVEKYRRKELNVLIVHFSSISTICKEQTLQPDITTHAILIWLKKFHKQSNTSFVHRFAIQFIDRRKKDNIFFKIDFLPTESMRDINT